MYRYKIYGGFIYLRVLEYIKAKKGFQNLVVLKHVLQKKSKYIFTHVCFDDII